MSFTAKPDDLVRMRKATEERSAERLRQRREAREAKRKEAEADAEFIARLGLARSHLYE